MDMKQPDITWIEAELDALFYCKVVREQIDKKLAGHSQTKTVIMLRELNQEKLKQVNSEIESSKDIQDCFIEKNK